MEKLSREASEHGVSSVYLLIDKDMVIEPISKMKNVKAAGQSELLSEMVKPACQAGLEIITDRMDQIIVEGVIPAELELSDIFNQ